MQTASFLRKSIIQYFNDFPDVILFYYADNAPISMNKVRKNLKISPQDFRHKLFSTILNRAKSESILFISLSKDFGDDKHRISIFSKSDNSQELEKLNDQLYEYLNSEK